VGRRRPRVRQKGSLRMHQPKRVRLLAFFFLLFP
jgi:hypothetical protein